MADQWFYARGGQQTGPVSFAELTDLARAGGLNSNDLVWQEGTPDWRPAGQVSGLFSAPVPAPALPPPPAGPSVQAPVAAQPVGYRGSFQPASPAYPSGSVPNYLVQAILVTIFCCLPFGIVAIVFAAQVDGKLAAGDYQGAVDASNKAKMWSWVSFGLTFAFGLLYFAFIILMAAAS